MNEYDKQAENFLNDTGTEFKAKYLKNGLHFPDDKDERDIYNITLTRKERNFKWTFKFGQSLHSSYFKTKPTAYDVLAGLIKCDLDTFKEFCSSYGYDEDSRKAEKIYKAVVEEWNKITRLWDAEVIKKLQEIN